MNLNSRAWEPIENIELEEGDDDLTTCHHCASRTNFIMRMASGAGREACAHCQQRYNVWEPGTMPATVEPDPLPPTANANPEFGSF